MQNGYTKKAFCIKQKGMVMESKTENGQSKWELLIQFIKFGIVGVSNTVVSYVINIGVLFLLDKAGLFHRWDYVIANTVAFLLSVLWSFYWNNKFVFDMENSSMRELLAALAKMYLSYAFTGIILSNVLSYVWIDMLHISKLIAPLINSAIGVPINFLLNKFWAFDGK
jgi:putative flippase GtrA